MCPRIDPDARRLEASVTEVVAAQEPSLSGLGAHGGRERSWLGQALHARIQARASAEDPGFVPERPLHVELEHASWRVGLHGRADGVRRRPRDASTAGGGWSVEEIKTGASARVGNAAHRRQLALYAWMLQLEQPDPVEAVLVRIDADGREERETLAWNAEQVRRSLERVLDGWIADFEAQRRRRRAARRGARRLRFPHARERPGQPQIRTAVESALEAGEVLLVEAAAGLGKTAAVLPPVLRFALETGRRVVVLTARNLQQERWLDTASRLATDAPFAAATLQARETLCANDVTLCHEATCRFALGFHDRLAPALAQALSGVRPAGRLMEIGTAHGVCPHGLARELARRAQLTVCDVHHAFSPGSGLERLAAGAAAGETLLVVDEVHQLAERARARLGATLGTARLARARAAAELGGAPVHRELAAALDGCLDPIHEIARDALSEAPGDRAVEHVLPHDALALAGARLDAAVGAYLDYRLATRSLGEEDPVFQAWFELRHFLEALEHRDGGFAEAVERRDGHAALRLHCLDAGPALRALFAPCHAVIGLSATLSPLEFHTSALGLDSERPRLLRVPSPYGPEQRRIVIDPEPDTRSPGRERWAPELARRLAAFAEAVPGHTLVLFPSFELLTRVERELPCLPRHALRCQRPDDGARSRREQLAALGAPPSQPVLLLAVSGGVFAEGVEAPGDGLRGIGVVGPCPPPPDLERELLRRRHEEAHDRGFEQVYAVPGMIRVVQAGGRLIRSERQRGVIALFGRRFLRAPYRDLLPEEWLDGRRPEQLVGDPAAAAQAFFATSS